MHIFHLRCELRDVCLQTFMPTPTSSWRTVRRSEFLAEAQCQLLIFFIYENLFFVKKLKSKVSYMMPILSIRIIKSGMMIWMTGAFNE